MAKLQITITDEEERLLTSKAAMLGYDVTKYAKFVLAREAEDALKNIPVLKATPTMEKLVSQAIEDEQMGRAKTWSTKYGN